MAQKIVIDLQVDGEKQINDLKIQLNDLKKTYDALVKAKKESKNGDRESVDAMEAATKAVNDLNKSLNAYETKASEANKAAVLLNTNTESLGKTATASATKMKTAFDVVNSTLQVANRSAKEVNATMLASKFPGATSLSKGETKQLGSAYSQAESIGEQKFDMARVASAAFRGDLIKTTEAIANYNNMFEQNPGASAIALNTAAILGLRSVVTTTTGSIAAMNKELSTQGSVTIQQQANVASLNNVLDSYSVKLHELILTLEMIREASIKQGNEAQSAADKFAIINARLKVSDDTVKAVRELGVSYSNLLKSTTEFNNSTITSGVFEALKMELADTENQLLLWRESFEDALSNPAMDKTGPVFGTIQANLEITEKKVNELKAELKDISFAQTFETSIKGMTQNLKSLRNEYSLLNKETREGDIGKKLSENIIKLNKELADAELRMAKVTTNTKNLAAGGFYPLTNSIQQLAREMPNFAISANIGFMAISNNLPILGDAITQFKALREEQKAAGEAVSSWGSGIKNALLNLPTLFVAISAAFIMFGDKLMTWIAEFRDKLDPLLKIKVEVNTEALKSIQKEYELVYKLKEAAKQLDNYRGEEHTKRLNRIKDVMVQEGILLKEQADNIKTKADLDDKYFNEYIRKSYEAAYNAEVFKKKAEQEVKVRYTEQEARAIKEELANAQKKIVSTVSGGGQFGGAITSQRDLTEEEKIAYREKALVSINKLTEDYFTLLKNNEDLGVWWTEAKSMGVTDKYLEKLKDIYTAQEELNNINKIELYQVNLAEVKDTGAGAKVKFDKGTVEAEAGFRQSDPAVLDQYYSEYLPKLRSYTEEELQIMSEGSQRVQGIYEEGIFGNASFVTKMDEARLRDLQNIKEALKEEFDTRSVSQQMNIDFYEQEIELVDQTYAELYADIVSQEEKIYNKKREINKAKTEDAKSSAEKELKVLEEEYNAKKVTIDKLLEDRKKYIDELALASNTDEITRLDDAIKNIDVNIAKMGQNINFDYIDEWLEKLGAVKDVMATIGEVYGGLASAQQAEMDTINAKYDEEAWQIQESITNNEAREKALYELEMKRYEALVVAFEMKKKYDEGQVWAELAVTYMNSAAGIVAAWKEPTPIAILKTAAIGVSTIAATIQAAASVKSIRAQRLEKPHKPANTGAGANYMALNPASSALTTKEENLNTISSSNKSAQAVSIVKVSDINKVQNDVSVRDRNSNY